MKTIYISDCTLKDAANERSRALLFREKVSFAKVIASLGVDAIELPKVKNPAEDKVINKTIASFLPDTALVLPAPDDVESVAAAWECLKEAKKPRLLISLPVSTVQMEYAYRLKNAGMLERIAALCAEAKKLCPSVEFAALDATRAEPLFLIQACETAEKNGADIVTLCDDAGETLPGDFAKIVASVRERVNCRLLIKVSDRLGLAASAALDGLCAGADGVKVSMDGKDALHAERLSDLIGTLGEKTGLAAGLDRTAIHTDISALLKSMRSRSYTEETGAPDAQAIVLDGDSTLTQVKEAAFALGYDLCEEDVGKVSEALKVICRKKGSVGAKEFEAIIASNAMQVPSTYHLDCYTATSGNTTLSVAQVTLVRDGERISGVASGDGPIDAAFLALENCVGHHYELDNFEIQSVTEGKEALGSSLVRLRHDGKLYSGNGLSTDIVGASIRAYVNALNKIVYDE